MTDHHEPAVHVDRMAAMVESSPDGMLLVDEHGVILLVNEQVKATFGYQREGLIGERIETLVPDRFRAVHTAHRTRYRVEPQTRAMGAELDLWARRRDGSELPVEISLSPITDSAGRVVVVSVRDISDRMARQAHSRLIHSAIDAAHDGVFMFRADTLRFTYVNQGAIARTGYSEAELLHMTPLHIKPDFTRASFLHMLAPLLADQVPSHTFRTRHRTKSGEDVPVEIVLEHPPAHGASARVLIAVARDITDRVAADAQRAHHQRWLEGLSDLRTQLLSDTPLDDVLRSICRHGCEILEADSAVLARPDATGDALDVLAHHGQPGSPDPGRKMPIEPAVREVLERLASTIPTAEASDDEGAGPGAGASEICTPMVTEGTVIGVLLIRRDASRPPFDHAEARLLTSFAQQATAALELAQARRDRHRLAMLEDRERIAEDLHDSVIQRLFAAGMGLQGVLPTITSTPTADRVRDTIDSLDATIVELRNAIFELNRPDDIGPVADRIAALVSEHTTHLGFRADLRVPDDLDQIPPDVATQLIPTINEALSNVARHAQASAVSISIDLTDADLVLKVTDDGDGVAADDLRGNGLDNLLARAQRVGGSCDVGTADGGGTAVTWSAPLAPSV